MSAMMPASQPSAQHWGERRDWPANLQRPSNHAGLSPGLLVFGLAALGLAALAAYQFGPDLVRYIKIERM
jgi:hypothetical protein